MKKIIKRISVIVICLILIFGSAKRAEAAAEAGALTILGGSVAAGGIGATIAAIAPPVAVIVGLALAAQGVYVALSEASEQAGMTKTDFIGLKLSEWALSSGKQYSDVCNTIADGTQITTTGNMILSGAAASEIYQFMNSLVQEDVIQPVPADTKYLVFKGVEIPVLATGQKIDCFVTSSGDVYGVQNLYDDDMAVYIGHPYGNPYVKTVYMFKKTGQFFFQPFINGVASGSPVSALSFNRNGLFVLQFASDAAATMTTELIPYVNDDSSYISSLAGQFDVQLGEAANITDGIYSDDVASVDSSVYNPAEGLSTVINPGLGLTDIAQEYGKSGTIAIDNYLETLQRALDGVQDNTLAISNTLTGVLENVAVGTYDPVGQATATQEDTATIPEVLTPVIDVTLNPSGSAAENSLKGLQFDLTNIFPFCIPFDIFALIEKFDVQPETPRILVSIPLPGMNETLDLDLDLSPFETVASILRSMELIAFIVGLALVTRNLIRG